MNHSESPTLLVLSLFPGIGLLDRAFEDEGFCVVRGPDLLWGGDVRRFNPPAGRFDGVIGGPPCQQFSPLANLARARGFKVAANLIPEFERCVWEARPRWFLMENVPQAPEPAVEGYVVHAQRVLNHFCGGNQRRVRRFSFGWRGAPRLLAVNQNQARAVALVPCVTANGGGRAVPVKLGGSGKPKKTLPSNNRCSFRECASAQGLPEDFDLPGFTAGGKLRAVGNGVPLAMGRAIAKAVRKVL